MEGVRRAHTHTCTGRACACACPCACVHAGAAWLATPHSGKTYPPINYVGRSLRCCRRRRQRRRRSQEFLDHSHTRKMSAGDAGRPPLPGSIDGEALQAAGLGNRATKPVVSASQASTPEKPAATPEARRGRPGIEPKPNPDRSRERSAGRDDPREQTGTRQSDSDNQVANTRGYTPRPGPTRYDLVVHIPLVITPSLLFST